MQVMATTKHLTGENVNLDDEREVDEFDQQLFAAGIARVLAQRAELRAKGLIDAEGNLVSSELPPDMCEGSERDFGG